MAANAEGELHRNQRNLITMKNTLTRLLLAVSSIAFAFASVPQASAEDLHPGLRGWEDVIAGKTPGKFPRYFRYKAEGGVFIRTPDSPYARIRWMLERQQGYRPMAGLARSMEVGGPNQNAEECAFRAVCIIAGVNEHASELGTFWIATATSPLLQYSHAFVVWEDTNGKMFALDTHPSGFNGVIMPLGAYKRSMQLRNVSLVQTGAASNHTKLARL